VIPTLRTERLILRPWRDSDRAPFAQMNDDPDVMRYFPAMLTAEESKRLVERIQTHFDDHGYGLWAVEVIGGPEFIGYCGLLQVGFEAPFAPAVEIGWRLAREHWDKGYATEAARAVLTYGFDKLGLDEIVSFTAPSNKRSVRVMERIGMTRDPADDFDHPALSLGHPLRRHALYRIKAGSHT